MPLREVRRTQQRAGTVLSDLSLDKCHDKLLALMDYDALRREQTEMRTAASIVASALPLSSSRPESDLRSTVARRAGFGGRGVQAFARADRGNPMRDQRHRSGAGDAHGLAADCREDDRSRYRECRDRQRRYDRVALRWRCLGLTRYRARRRSGFSRCWQAAREYSCHRGLDSAGAVRAAHRGRQHRKRRRHGATVARRARGGGVLPVAHYSAR